MTQRQLDIVDFHLDDDSVLAILCEENKKQFSVFLKENITIVIKKNKRSVNVVISKKHNSVTVSFSDFLSICNFNISCCFLKSILEGF